MRKNKGFTLIELLAVIVILAIIALIAVPQIMGVIETARKGSAESSALGYIDAVEKQIMINDVEQQNQFDLTSSHDYSIADLDAKGVTVKGKKPTCPASTTECVTVGTSGEVTSATLVVNNYTVTYPTADGKASAVKN